MRRDLCFLQHRLSNCQLVSTHTNLCRFLVSGIAQNRVLSTHQGAVICVVLTHRGGNSENGGKKEGQEESGKDWKMHYEFF